MSTVYFDLSISLDGYVAGPNVTLSNPLGDDGERLHDWMFVGRSAEQARTFEEDVFAPCGAMLMGRTMLDVGIEPWGEEPTFHMPVFILTHRPHEPVVKLGGTTYYFVTTGLADALEQARAAAGGKDIVIAGGANLVRQCLAAGMVQEFRLHLVPVVLGGGVRLFDGVAPFTAEPAASCVLDSHGVTHLHYRMRDRARPE
jgi:dihydrofolate reductase